MIERRVVKPLLLGTFILLILFVAPALGAGDTESISTGMELPNFTLPGSESGEVQSYLGLKGSEAFTLPEVSGKIVFIEILDVL